uniref:Uncharacterized protein n=1 Tax=Taeniopygia guttata TaxID=59729 RepID=A0A674HCD8_TAEGU
CLSQPGPQCAPTPPCHPVPSPQHQRGTGDAGIPQEGPALQAIGQPHPGMPLGAAAKWDECSRRARTGTGCQNSPGKAQRHHKASWGLMQPPGDISEGFSRPVQLLLLLPSVQLPQLSCTRVLVPQDWRCL